MNILPGDNISAWERINDIANTFSITLGALTAIFAFIVYYSGARLQTLKDDRLYRIQADSDARIAQANSISETAKAEAAKANRSAAEANLHAQKVEQQNIELRQKFANRRITVEQHQILVTELSKHKAVFNMETMSDTESTLYAADIFKTFTDAGWKVDKKTFPLGVSWIGLILFQTDDPNILVIADALKKAGIPFGIGNQQRNKATIMVGGKAAVF